MRTVSSVNAHVVSSLVPSATPTALGLFPQEDLCDFMYCLLQHGAVGPMANSVFGVATHVAQTCRTCKTETAKTGVLSPIFPVSLSENDKIATINDLVQRQLQEAAAHANCTCACGGKLMSGPMATLSPAGSHLAIALDRASLRGKITTQLRNGPLRQRMFKDPATIRPCLWLVPGYCGYCGYCRGVL